MPEILVTEEDAICGSEQLLQAIEKTVFRFGWRYKITSEEARHLLLNTGVRVPA